MLTTERCASSEYPHHFQLNSTSSLYLFDEESVVFSTSSKQLYGLDRTATVILFRLEQGEELADISADLGLSLVARLSAEKLADVLAGRETPTDEYPNDFTCPLKPPYMVPEGLRFRLLKTCLAIEGPDQILDNWIIPYLEPLRTCENHEVNLVISFECSGDKWILRMNGMSQGNAISAQHLLPLLHCRLRIFAYQNQHYLLAVHGTVLNSPRNQTIILAGRSGAGKSTLAATLLGQGYTLVSDEPVVIDAGTCNALAMPLGLGLKDGSWPLLLTVYPEIKNHPIHIRFDGQEIRYLLPDSIDVATNTSSFPVTHLIFLEYNPSFHGEIKRLSTVQTLNLINGVGYQVPGLDEERVAGILNWLAGIDKFSLVYSSSEEALHLLNNISQ